jgi:hypothetical protein
VIPIVTPQAGPGGVAPDFPVIPPSTVIPSYMANWHAIYRESGFKLWGTTPSYAFPRATAKNASGLNPPTLQVTSTKNKAFRAPATALPHLIAMHARDATSFYGFAMFQANDGVTYPTVGFKVGSLWNIYLGGRYGNDGPGRRKLLGCVYCGCSEGTPTDGLDPYEICGNYACPYSNCCCPI